MGSFISLQPNNECYKNLNNQRNCSKCNITITRDNYKKGRTVCKLCYNDHILAFYKNKFRSNQSPKSDVTTQTEIPKRQDSSKKQDGSVSLKNVDTDFVKGKLSELLIANMIVMKKLKLLGNMLRRSWLRY